MAFKRFVPKFKSFASKVSLRAGVIFCFGFLVFIAVSSYIFYTKAKNYESERLEDEVLYLTADIQAKINTLRADVSFLASVPPIQGIIRAKSNKGIDPLDGSSEKEWIKRLHTIFYEMLASKKSYDQIRYIGVANGGKELVRHERKGSKIFEVPQGWLQKKGQSDYFKETIKRNPYEIYLSRIDLNRERGKIQLPKRLVIRAAVPIYDLNNKVFGFVIINMEARSLFAKLFAVSKFGKSVSLIDDRGDNLLNVVPEEFKSFNIDDYKNNNEIASYLASGSEKSTHTEINQRLIVATKVFYNKEVPDKYLGIILTTPNSRLNENVITAIEPMVLVLFFLSIILLLGLFFHIKKQIEPVRELKKLTNEFTQTGSISIPDKILDRYDEISDLAFAFKNMAKEIEYKSQDLKFQGQALDQSALVSEADARGRITRVNKKFCTVSGYTEDELLGVDHRILNSKYHPKEFFVNMWKTISSGKPWRGEIRNQKKDGSFYWVDSSIIPITDSKGRVTRYISIRYEISDRIKMTEELRRSNEELEQFAYIASHDLKTPLRGLVTYSEFLLRDHKQNLNKEGQEMLVDLDHEAKKMDKFVSELLKFSRVGNGDLAIGEVDLAKETQGIVKSMSVFLQDKNAEVKGMESLPKQVCDRTKAPEIFRNLIENGIKYNDSDKKIIIMGFNQDPEKGRVYFVKDNGIGIPEQHLDKVFRLFKRLHGENEYGGGSGAGLAIVQKIVEKHGGKIWIESQEGLGTTFFFTLSKDGR